MHGECMHTARVGFRVLDNLVRYRYQGISARFAMPSHRGRQQARVGSSLSPGATSSLSWEAGSSASLTYFSYLPGRDA